MVIVIMGVSGSGKTTIGQLLEKKMSYVFIDADDYHSDKNKLKMINNVALNQEDREPWLKSLRILLDKYIENKKGLILACSALSKDSRSVLGTNRIEIHLVYLKGSKSLIKKRMVNRNHFMPSSLLDSQFLELSEPTNALVIDINQKPSQLATQIHNHIQL